MEIVEAKKYGSQTSNSKWDNFDKDEYLNSKVAFNEGLFAYPCQLRNIWTMNAEYAQPHPSSIDFNSF